MPSSPKKIDRSMSWRHRILHTAVVRIAWPHSIEREGLAYWRATILLSILISAQILGVFAIAATIGLIVSERAWGLAIFDGVAFLIGLLLIFSKTIRYETRASVTLLLCYTIGMAIIVSVGPLSGGPAWLFAFAVLVGVLLGPTPALLAIVLNALSLATMAWMVSTGRLTADDPFFKTPQAMMAAGVNFIVLNTIAAVSVAALVKGLVAAHGKEKALSEKLAAEKTHLVDARKRLEKEVEERSAVETALIESEEKNRLLLEQVNAIVWTVDPHLRITSTRGAGLAKIGQRPDQAAGMHMQDFLDEGEMPETLLAAVAKALAGESVTDESEFGGYTWMSHLEPLRDAEDTIVGCIAVSHDISERSRMEMQLQQAQKFEAIGTLAGGIAHDFNNLLMGIQGRASLMGADQNPFHPHREHVEAIETYVRSATDLTKQLLGIARGGKYNVVPLYVNDLVLKSSSMFGRTKKEIGIHRKLANPSPVVAADQRQLEQVLLNLYVNAWQAMPNGGELYLETKTIHLEADDCRSHQVRPGLFARISVTDTGIGMPKSIRERIFDPFFTTKEKERGTGLGLASAYGIIKNHSGIISVRSEVKQGTTITIDLPMSGKRPAREQPAEKKAVQGSGTILLVDDEEMILEVGQAMLEKLGYRVVPAAGGLQALTSLSESGEKFDLVVLDLIMPGLDGRKTFDRIRARFPEMPVILSSGYAIEGLATDIMNRGCDGFIQKPFNIAELSHILRKVLGPKTTTGQQ
jgi:two-component system cell cycle sensor histidine kinase/response regulator CckA